MNEPIRIEPSELKAMIAEYMEKGFLENIIDMFKHDEKGKQQMMQMRM